MCLSAAAAAYIGMAAAAAGAATSAYSAHQTGKFNSAMAEQNAEIQNQAITDANRRGENQANEQRIKAQRVIGSQKAALAASGIDMASGTALDMLTESAGLGELDALTSRNNSQREAYGYAINKLDAQASGQMARFQGRMGVGSSLLSGASQVGSQYVGYKSLSNKTGLIK